MEGRNLLYAQVFNGPQKLLKLSLQTIVKIIVLFSVDFWEFRFFSYLYTYLELKSIRCSTSFMSQKWQPIWQEGRVGGYEGRKGMIFFMFYPWHRLFIE